MSEQVYAIVLTGTVVNIVLWDGTADWQPPAGSSAVAVGNAPEVSIGWTYNGTTFAAPV